MFTRFAGLALALVLICSPVEAQQRLQVEGWAWPRVATPGRRLDVAIRINVEAELAYITTTDATLDPSAIVGALGPCSGAGLGAVCNVAGEDYRRLALRLVPRAGQGCGQLVELQVALDHAQAPAQLVTVPLACSRVLVPVALYGVASADYVFAAGLDGDRGAAGV